MGGLPPENEADPLPLRERPIPPDPAIPVHPRAGTLDENSVRIGGLSSFSLGSAESIARRGLSRAQNAQNVSLERIATGKRINSAADDPAGLVASENFKAHMERLTERIEARERENLRYAAREGALSVTGDLVLELQGLIVQAANGDTLDDAEKEGISTQIASVIKGINSIAATSTYNSEQIIKDFTAGKMGRVSEVYETTDADGNTVSKRVDYSLASLVRAGVVSDKESGLEAGEEIGVLDIFGDDAELAQRIADAAVDRVSGQRAAIGNRMRENESMIRVEMVELENTARANSLIEDADYATEISDFIRNGVIAEAATQAMLVARSQAEGVLQLLQGVTSPS